MKIKSVEPLIEMDLHFRSRLDCYYQIVLSHLKKEKLTFLEVGVFQGEMYKYFSANMAQRIERYVGVDPYLGDERDPYFVGYWKGKKENADAAHDLAKSILEAKHGPLVRETSADYFARSGDTFDVVILDGDHRADPAYLDLVAGWKAVRPGGLVLMDDFANPDHPGVHAAVKRFELELAQPQGIAAGCRFAFFTAPHVSRRLPYPLGVVYWIKPDAPVA
jgi:hypothetical protein